MTGDKLGLVERVLATFDSANDPVRRFGILNAQGEFWTTDIFFSTDAAWQHLFDFWGRNTEARDQCLKTHRIVPIRIVLHELPAAAIEGLAE